MSTATVSRVLNHPEKVGAKVIQRVQAALNELAYVRHGAARALASQRSHAIGIVVPTLGVGLFAKGVEVLQRQLEEKAYTLLLANSRYDAGVELREVRTLVERGIDGVALVGNYRLPEVYRLLDNRKIPYVNTYVYDQNNLYPCVGIDNRAATYKVAKHLLDLEHRNFGVIANSTQNNDRALERVTGIRTCLADHGIKLPDTRVLEIPYSVADGRVALRSLREVDPGITAVMCTSDTFAIGALLEALDCGIEVPKRLSITGFDDFEISSQLQPPLTTVRVPAEELGVRVAQYLLNRISGHPVPHRTELEANLIIRGSTGPAPS